MQFIIVNIIENLKCGVQHTHTPGIVGTFHHRLLTATSNSFRFLEVVLLVLHIVSFEPAPASVSLRVAEVSNRKVEVQVLSVLAAKPNEGFQLQLNQRNK